MTEIVQYSCRRCERPGKSAAHILEHQIRNNRARCQYCGGPLALPAEFQARIDNPHDLNGFDLRQEITYGCGRHEVRTHLGAVIQLLQRRKTRCQTCGAPLQFPPVVEQALASFLGRTQAPTVIAFACPLCERPMRTRSPDALVACAYCGAEVRGPAQPGGSWRCPPLDVPPATPEDVGELTGRLKRCGPIGACARRALQLRARAGELAPAEAIVAAARIATWSGWAPDPDRPRFLPLSVEDAESLLPPLLFPGHDPNRDEQARGVVDLVFAGGAAEDLTRRGAAGAALGAFDAVVQAVATVAEPGLAADRGSTGELRLRLRLQPTHGGIEVDLFSQPAGGSPIKLSRAGARSFQERLHTAARLVPRHYALAALFGSWAAGRALHVVPRSAVEQRVAGLGWPAAERVAAVNCLTGE